jgi:hypothetical protein
MANTFPDKSARILNKLLQDCQYESYTEQYEIMHSAIYLSVLFIDIRGDGLNTASHPKLMPIRRTISDLLHSIFATIDSDNYILSVDQVQLLREVIESKQSLISNLYNDCASRITNA